MATADEFAKMKALFEDWAENGVPRGVQYPTTQSEAVGWSCERFGIKGVGSKREFKTTSVMHGAVVKEINALIKRLLPIEEAQKLRREKADAASKPSPSPTRKYVTQKARRVAAEDETDRVRTMLDSTLAQLQQTRQALESAERDVIFERQRFTQAQKNVVNLGAEIAELKRMLAARSGPVLQLVE